MWVGRALMGLAATGVVALGLLTQQVLADLDSQVALRATLQRQAEAVANGTARLSLDKTALESAIAAAERRRQALAAETQQQESRLARLRDEQQSLETRLAALRHQISIQTERLQAPQASSGPPSPAAPARTATPPPTVPAPASAPIPVPPPPATVPSLDDNGAPVVPGHKPRPR